MPAIRLIVDEKKARRQEARTRLRDNYAPRGVLPQGPCPVNVGHDAPEEPLDPALARLDATLAAAAGADIARALAARLGCWPPFALIGRGRP